MVEAPPPRAGEVRQGMLGLMKLDNPIQRYAWGSRTALARLQGRQAATEPEAELWIGAHPQASSAVTVGGRRVTLDRLVAERPAETLGWAAERFGPALPFLLKVLAVAQPLSIQAHPSRAQAAAGFAREQAAGIAPDAPNRNYRDRNHKPEVAVALEPYWQLSGFRPYAELVRHLEAIGSPPLKASIDALRHRPGEATVRSLMATALELSEWQRADLVMCALQYATGILRASSAEAGAREQDAEPDAPDELAVAAARWVQRLAASYPRDAGAISPYLLNLVRLAPGEGIHIGAGTLHAALQGTAVELQANSDNVLRGGITAKHIDVSELLRMARFAPQQAAVLNPPADAHGERHYVTPAAEFALSSVALDRLPPGSEFAATVDGPEVLLLLHGDAVVTDATGRSLDCRAGEALFVPDAVGGYRVRGAALLFRARVPEPER